MAETASPRNLSDSSAVVPGEVVLVGTGRRARAWLDPLRRSSRLRLVATVARDQEAVVPELPHYVSLGEAMRRHPQASFAVALPPRAGLDAAFELAQAGRSAVVEAPLADALIDSALDARAAAIRVAHGWLTLPGLRAIEAAMQRAGSGQLRIEVAGLPEEEGGDAREILVHAAALVRGLLPQAAASAARRTIDGALEFQLAAPAADGGWKIDLRLLGRGQRLSVRVEAAAETVRWAWQGDHESVTSGRKQLIARHPTVPAAVRALAQLLPEAGRGDGLVEAASVLRLARHCLSHLPAQLPIGQRRLRQSAAIAQRRPADTLARLGLRGALPAESVEPASALTLAAPREPFELWAYRAGIKPVVFLTVEPGEVERTLAYFSDAHVERRERLVRIEAQDKWCDRRDEGEARIELYLARDPELARRAAYLQAEVDPSRAMRELGQLVGYPPCCVDAFAQQDDRANNSGNRYHSYARTLAADGSTVVPWPWELNNLHTMIIPFYPCSYRCARALAWARAALGEMARAYPEFVDELRGVLARPVLYFDHDHQLIFDGEYAEDRIKYQSVAVAHGGSLQFAALAAAIAGGDELAFNEESLLVLRSGRIAFTLARTDPALGFIAPFGR